MPGSATWTWTRWRRCTPGRCWPAGVILAAVLHFLDTASAREVVAGYASRVVPGSWLVVSVGHYEDLALHEKMCAAFPSQPYYNHGAADFTAWLEGLELVPP